MVLTGSTRLIRKLKVKKLSDMVDKWKHRVVSRWLYKNYKDTIVDSITVDSLFEKKSNGNRKIFVFWWQGEQTAPPIVKVCIASIYKWSDGFGEIVILNKNNFLDYLSLPDYIVNKISDGTIGLAHFSDILRFNLLKKYGGIWIDATCFLSKNLPKYILDYSFYSIKGAYDNGLGWQWTSFFMFAKKNDLLVENMCRFYNAYWKEHNEAITYLVLDCWITALRKHVPAIDDEINKVPFYGTRIFTLISHIQEIYTSEHYKELLTQSFINKLTYKEKWEPMKDGNITIFGHLIEKYR